MKKNKLHVAKFFFVLIIFKFEITAQCGDTIKTVSLDKDLIFWTEDYIVNVGYIQKTNKGYQLPLSNHYFKNLDGLYSLDVIEKQEFDSLIIVLCRLHAGYENDRPIIITQIGLKNKKPQFQAIGGKSDLESLAQIYIFFEHYKKFSRDAQLFCYKMLLENYDWRNRAVEE